MLNFNNSSSWVHVGEVIRMLLFLESATEPSAQCHRRSSSKGNLGEKSIVEAYLMKRLFYPNYTLRC